ncbi:MAG: hypothetical protein IIU55_03735 [Paludibacteraceae bacterium]|nr:hypothetical protein [Paludibacteraceae bacterium]
MKKNVNVFIGVVLCAVLCGTFVWLQSAGDEDTWKPTEIYDQIHTSASATGASYTTAISSGAPVSGGVALSMSSRSSMRRTPAFSYAGASYAPAASSPLASSPMGGASGAGLYTTSSAEMKSFGGGGNGSIAMGGRAMSKAQSAIASAQSGAGLSMASTPISYSSARHGGMNVSGEQLVMMSAQTPDLAMASVYGYSADEMTSAGFYQSYTSGAYGSMGGGRSGISGRKKSGNTNSLLDWLSRNWVDDKYGTKTGSDADGWYYTVTYSGLQAAYEDYVNNYWDPMWGPAPDIDEWITWFQNGGEAGYEYNGNWYKMLPVGDIVPLLLLALLYVVFLMLRTLTFQTKEEK